MSEEGQSEVREETKPPAERKAKQIIVVRKDLGMRKGKMIAQGAHASMAAVLQRQTDGSGNVVEVRMADNEALRSWFIKGVAKIAVGVTSEEELVEVHQRAKSAGLLTSLIRDAGKTEFGGVPTLTACAIGPAFDDELESITGHLKLL